MATKKVVPAKKEKKAPRVKGKGQVIYFPGPKLNVLKALEKQATKDRGISEIVVEALEAQGVK